MHSYDPIPSIRQLGRLRRLAGLALCLGMALVATATIAAGQEPEGPNEGPPNDFTVVVGTARLTWHLQPSALATGSGGSKAMAELIERFRLTTTAHFTGDELPARAKTEAEQMAEDRQMPRLPADVMPTMFVGASGVPYCTDSATPNQAVATGNVIPEDR